MYDGLNGRRLFYAKHLGLAGKQDGPGRGRAAHAAVVVRTRRRGSKGANPPLSLRVCAIFLERESPPLGHPFSFSPCFRQRSLSHDAMIHLYSLGRLFLLGGLAAVSLFWTHIVLLRNNHGKEEGLDDEPRSRRSAPNPTQSGQTNENTLPFTGPVATFGDGLAAIGAVLSCGRKKCLFPVVDQSTKNNDKVDPADTTGTSTSKGYLISNGDAKQYQRAFDAWRYAKYLEHHYGLRQTLLDKPVQFDISADLAKNHLNVDFSGSGRLGYKNSTRQFEAGPAIAQPVQIVAQPWILVGCYGRYESSVKKLERFVSKVMKGALAEVDATATNNHFLENFAHDLNQTDTILQESEVECLYHDFQLILDAEGHLVHMDLDRCLAQVRRNDGKGKITRADQRLCRDQMHSLLAKSRQQMLGG